MQITIGSNKDSSFRMKIAITIQVLRTFSNMSFAMNVKLDML